MLRWVRIAFLDEFLLISIAAAVGVIQTELLVSGCYPEPVYPLLAALLTFSFYQLHKWVSQHWLGKQAYDHSSISTKLPFAIIGWIITSIVLIYVLLTKSELIVLLLLPAFLIGGAYVLPAFRYQRRLRDMRLIKIFLISFTWSWVIGVWPALQYEIYTGDINWWFIILIALERMAFIYALTVPFDIRDLKLDKLHGTITVPYQLGLKNAKRTAYTALILHFILFTSILWIAGLNMITPVATLLLTGILIWNLIKNAHPDKPDYYFSLYIDGCIILQAMLMIISVEMGR